MFQRLNPRVLITGGDGMVGSYFTSGIRVSKKDCDVTDILCVKKVFEQERPNIVVHLAALTDMDFCEQNKDLAYKVNEIGTKNVATIARSVGAKVIYISTNAIFDGKKQGSYSTKDAPHPISVYGDSKYKGELAVLEINPKNLVVRTSWVFGGGIERDKKFVGKIVPKILSGESIKAVVDVCGTPTYTKDLVKAITNLFTEDKAGVIHITNAGKASRYDMALVIRDALGFKNEVIKVPLASFLSTGNTLQNETLESNVILRPWQDALGEYMKTEWKMFIKK